MAGTIDRVASQTLYDSDVTLNSAIASASQNAMAQATYSMMNSSSSTTAEQRHSNEILSLRSDTYSPELSSTRPSDPSETFKKIMARHLSKNALPSKPLTTEQDGHGVVAPAVADTAAQTSFASALPALARQHAAKLAGASLSGTPLSYASKTFTPSTNSMSLRTPNTAAFPSQSLQASQHSQHMYTSSPATTLAAAAHLATMGVGVGPGINPNITNSAGGLSVNGNPSNPPIVNTGNNGPMYVQPGDWVCSACGFVNWRRRRVCMRCYPFADQTEVSKQIAQGAVLAAKLAAGVAISPDAFTPLTQSRRSTTLPTSPVNFSDSSFPSGADENVNHLTVDSMLLKADHSAEGLSQGLPTPMHLWTRRSPVQAQPPFLDGASRSTLSSRNDRGVVNDGHGEMRGSPFASMSSLIQASSSLLEKPQFASAQPSPIHTPNRAGKSLGVGSTTEFPWSSVSIWSAPATPNNISTKAVSSPLASPALPRAVPDSSSALITEHAKCQARLQDVSPETQMQSSALEREGHLVEFEERSDGESIKSALTTFIDEQDEIVIPAYKSHRRGLALPSNSPTREASSSISFSSDGQYQQAAIEPPCRSSNKSSKVT